MHQHRSHPSCGRGSKDRENGPWRVTRSHRRTQWRKAKREAVARRRSRRQSRRRSRRRLRRLLQPLRGGSPAKAFQRKPRDEPAIDCRGELGCVRFGSVADISADLNVVEYVGQLAPRYPLESLLTACALPTERALSDLNCAEQAGSALQVLVKKFEGALPG